MTINLPILAHEVPDLRESIGWERRSHDYPILFERCQFWAGKRDNNGILIAFGYLAGMGLQHGYMEDIMVHPSVQGKGIGTALVKTLLAEAERTGIEIVTLTYDSKHTDFYKKCGFTFCHGGVWRPNHVAERE